MSKTVPKPSVKDLPAQLAKFGHKAARLAPISFVLLVAGLYAFLLLRINILSNIQPDQSEVSSQVAKLTPHIDQKAVAQLQGLEDNNVNVQTLFNDARNNPFGE